MKRKNDDGRHLLNGLPVYQRTEAVCKAYVEKNPSELIHVPEEICTETFCLSLITSNPAVICFIPEKMRNQSFYLAAAKKNGQIIEHLEEDVEEDVYLAGIQQHPYLSILPLKIRHNKKLFERLCEQALAQNPEALTGIPLKEIPETILSENICATLVADDRNNLKNVPSHFLTENFFLVLVKNNYAFLRNVPDYLLSDPIFSEKIYLEAISNNSKALALIPEENHTPAMQEAALISDLLQDRYSSFELEQLLLHPSLTKIMSKLSKESREKVLIDLLKMEINASNKVGVERTIALMKTYEIWDESNSKDYQFDALLLVDVPSIANIMSKIPKESRDKVLIDMLKEKMKRWDEAELQRIIDLMNVYECRVPAPWELEPSHFMQFKVFNKVFKQGLVKHNKIVPDIQSSALITPAEAILQQTRYQGKPIDLLERQKFRADLNTFTNYKTAPLMAPMLYVMALAALNKHEGPHASNKPKKPLKVIVYDTMIMQYILQGEIKQTNGSYTHRSTIYATKDRCYSIYHESTHMVANEVMQNACNPYPKANNSLQTLFDRIVTEVQDAIPKFICNSPLERFALSSFLDIYELYPQHQWARELIVKIPETLSFLGYDKGYNWLKQNTPSLVDYYENHFQPAVIDYLARNNAEQYLALSDDFKTILELTKSTEQFKKI